MERLKKVINDNLSKYAHFDYYLPQIDKILKYQESEPDVSIETCNALIQGLSLKMIQIFDIEAFNNLNFKFGSSLNEKIDVYTSTKECLNTSFTLFLTNKKEKKLPKQCSELIEIVDSARLERVSENISEEIEIIRNETGDICHGRLAPKKVTNDASFSFLVMSMTEGVLYLLFSRFLILMQENEDSVLKYKDCTDFNTDIDKKNPLKDKLLYSKILYDNYREIYRIKYKEYLERIEENEGDAA